MSINLNQPIDQFIPPKHVITGTKPVPFTGTIGIVCATFNLTITQSLLMGAINGLLDHGLTQDHLQTIMVPGAFEVPLIADQLLTTVDLVIAIACVIRGDTPHFDYVCQGITHGITTAIHTHKKPVIFCVLTTNTIEEAKKRAVFGCTTNKGYEAANGALEMIGIQQLMK